MKEMGTRTREYWSLSGTGMRSSCDDCGRPELRVGYRCKAAPMVGSFCRRIRCWKCAEIKRVEKKSQLGDPFLGWLYYANVGQPLCKACRAEEILTGEKRSTLSL